MKRLTFVLVTAIALGITLLSPSQTVQMQGESAAWHKDDITKMKIATTGAPIILPHAGTVRVTILYSDTSCPGSFGIYSPINRELWWDYRVSVGQIKEVGLFDAGTELVFYIAVRGWCNSLFYSNGSHCRVTTLGDGKWQLNWEDWTDWDWNDVVMKVELQPIEPASQGYLQLTAATYYNPAQPITPIVSVHNPISTTNSYTVTVSLLQDGTTLDTIPRSVTVPGGGSATFSDINFGTRPAGLYRLQAALWLGGTQLDTQEINTGVVSGDQARALRWVDLLTKWSYQEFKQGADLVVDTNVDSLSRMDSELANWLFGKCIAEWIGVLGHAIGMGNDDINRAIGTIVAKLLGFKELVAASPKQLRPLAQQKVDTYLTPERQKVENKRQATADFLRSSDFHWTGGLAVTLHEHGDYILKVVETEPISKGILPPPRLIGKSTLSGQRVSWEFYDLYGKIFSALAVAAAVAVILVSAVPSAGASAGLIPGLSALRGHASLVAVGITAFLGLITIGMDLNFERVVAPAITREHAMALDLFQGANQIATGISFDSETSVAQVGGREVSLGTNLRNTAPEKAQPLVETYVYSPDGRVVRIISAQPVLQPGQNTLIQGQAILPRGSYRAISAIHTRERFGLISQVLAFDVTGPQIQLGVSLADSQLSLGEALHTAIFITNTNPVSDTGDVAIMAISTDEQNFDAWVVSLAPGASQRLEYSFVPQTAGSYVLQVNATDGYELLARWDTAYIVGDGPSLALNYSTHSIYDPGTAVTIPITATNAGNLPTSTALSLVILDRLRDMTAVYTNTIPLSVAAGASLAATAIALPAPQAQPGLYTARLFLGDNLYTSLDFAVAAEDTIFADIYPDNVFHAVGDTVTLTIQVMNSVYTYTDALVAVSLWRPDGITQTVAMNPISTGQYQGTVTAPITGTYLAAVDVSRPNYRAVGNNTFFVAGEHSQLLPTFDGHPIQGTTQPVTVTVRNEQGIPIAEASLVVSGTMEYMTRQTDGTGQAVLYLSPTITEPYQVSLEKLGFAQTVMDLPVWVAPDTTPPALFLDVPSITNSTPITVTGLTEAGANLTINGQGVIVDAQGRFTTTVALSEGKNLLTARAVDAVGNTTTLTRTMILDTLAPTLTVTYPPNGLVTNREVISVTGGTEVSASLTVSGTMATVAPVSGAFSSWVLLNLGENVIPVTATDAAGNTKTITRSVFYTERLTRLYLPLAMKNFRTKTHLYLLPIMKKK